MPRTLAGGARQKQRRIVQGAGPIERHHHIMPCDADIVELAVVEIMEAIARHTIAKGTPHGFRSQHHEAKAAIRTAPFVNEVEFSSAVGRAHWTILSQARERPSLPWRSDGRAAEIGRSGKKRPSILICDPLIAENLLISPTNVSNG
jgi:hypothetical protein